MILVSVDGPLGTGAIGDKDQVIFRKHDSLLHALDLALDGGGHLSASLDVKEDIGHLHTKLEVHPGLLQVLFHGQDQRFILVIAGKLQGAEIRQAGNVVDEALEVELHLQGGVPVFKSEHGAPVEPEGGGKYLIVKDILNGLVVQVLIRGHKELDDLHAPLLTEVKLSVGVGILSPVDGSAAQGVVGIVLIEPIKLIQHRSAGLLQRGNGAEQVPQALEVVLHLPAAPHDISAGGVVDAVAGAAGYIHGLQDVDTGTIHLSVPHQETGCRQSGQAAAHNIGALLLHARRLLRPGKGLVVAVGIIDALGVFLVSAQLRVAVVTAVLRLTFRLGILLILCRLFRQHHSRSRAGKASSRSSPLSKILCHKIATFPNLRCFCRAVS